MPELSILIPSRNEPWLKNTVEDILKNARADTEVIVILDGGWPVEPLAQHEKVTLVYHPKSVGQRAATNEAARLSNAKYIAKCDAHVSVAEGFDIELIKSAQELGPDVTQIPTQKNLHVFDWMCDSCGNRTYQGPTLKSCAKCQGTSLHKEMVWKPRRGVTTHTWRFDAATLHFAYWGDYSRRQEFKETDFPETMSCLGAFWFLERERYWQLGGLDESHGSWGAMGTEMGCKSWLSGGRMVTNKRTHFSHLFRTQGGDFSFPYEIHGSDQEKARKYSRNLWLNNAWPGQIRPLSWLIEHFRPLPDWHDASGAARLAEVMAAGAAFTPSQQALLSFGRELGEVSGIGTDTTVAAPLSGTGMESQLRERVPLGAVGSAGLLRGGSGSTEEIGSHRDEAQVGRVAAQLVVASVIDNEHVSSAALLERAIEPRAKDPVDMNLRAVGSAGREADSRVADVGDVSGPEPAASAAGDPDLTEDPSKSLAIEVSDGQNAISHSRSPSQASSRSGAGAATTASVPTPHILPPNPRPGIVFYTENRLDPVIASACRKQLVRAANGIPIVSVSINGPCDLGQNIELPYERSYLSMFRQILVGLEAIDADIVFLAEHDVLYAPSHFEFVPPRGDVYYYDLAVWKIDAATGRALHYITRQTSGLCASRSLLLEHYRKRVGRVERDGFNRRIGFEPGSHGRAERIDDYGAVDWRSAVPNVDIRHDKNLTSSRWAQSEFRSQRNCQGWTEGDAVPGWPGKTLGRFPEWLKDVVEGGK